MLSIILIQNLDHVKSSAWKWCFTKDKMFTDISWMFSTEDMMYADISWMFSKLSQCFPTDSFQNEEIYLFVRKLHTTHLTTFKSAN